MRRCTAETNVSVVGLDDLHSKIYSLANVQYILIAGHTCPECSESFPTLAVYRKHLADKNHTDNPAICDICGDRFNGLPLLKKHVLKMHKQGKPKNLPFTPDLQKFLPINLVHFGADAKKYGCKYCEKSFTLKSNLERHMRMHTEVQKGFICEKCGTEYFSSQALKDHCNQAHVEMKPFECNFCKKRFSHQRSLRKHAQSHSEERPFVCDICVQVSWVKRRVMTI